MALADRVMDQIIDLQKVGFTPTDLYLGDKEYYVLRNQLTQQGVGVLSAFGLTVHITDENSHLMVAGKRNK